MGDAWGGSGGSARVGRWRACSTLGEGGRQANLGGGNDKEVKHLDGGRWEALEMHVFRVSHHPDVGEGPLDVLQGVLQRQGEDKGAAGITLANPPLGGEGGRLGGRPLDDEEPMGPVRPGGEKEEPWRPTSDRLQKGLPRNAVESVLEIKLHVHVVGAAGKACAERMAHALAPPWNADAEL
jgi:hypothetical protein